MATDLLAVEQIKRYTDLAAIRSSFFQSTWQDLSDLFMPSQSNINTKKTPGTVSGWGQQIYDTTAIHAAQVLGAGQRNWLTPSNEKWFDFEVPEFLSDPNREDEKDEASSWLANATEIATRELARSNFYAMVNIDYDQIGVFGTGMMFVEEGKRGALNFRQFKPWHLTIEENDEGIVDSVHREFELTTRQAVQQFGLSKVGEKIAKAYGDAGQLSKKWKFLHACFPREDSKRIKGRMDGENKAYASVYIAMDDMQCVEVSGYDEMPYLCSRFKSWGADTPWGYSPAYLTLPEARQLNYVARDRDALSELRVNPRLLYPDNLEGDVDLRPGGVTVFDGSEPNSIPREWATVGDDKAAEENMQRKADAINSAFYVNMFTMLEQLADKKMTAYEIAQRLAEKLEQFTPVFDRRVTEFLNPLLNRIFGLLFRQGKFGQPPQSLLVPVDGGKGSALALPVVAITSRISMALKALQNQAIVNTLSVLQPLAQIKPEVMDNFDLDEMVRGLARNYGMSPEYLMSTKDMAKVRAARQQAMAAQQAAELAERLGGTVKDLGSAPKGIQDAVVSQFAPAA
jgi:hypothetical protein